MKRSLTIANGTSLSSSAADFGPIARLCAIVMPSAWTAADITFQVSDDGVTFQNMFDDQGTEVKVTSPAADKTMAFKDDFKRLFSRFQFVKVRSGTSGAAVNQGADRSVILLADTPQRV